MVNILEIQPKTFVCFPDIFRADLSRRSLDGYLQLQILTIASCGDALKALQIVWCISYVADNLSFVGKADQTIVEIPLGTKTSIVPIT